MLKLEKHHLARVLALSFGLVLLLIWVVLWLGGDIPPLPSRGTDRAFEPAQPPMNLISAVLTPTNAAMLRRPEGGINPVFTEQFKPPPEPPPPPPEPRPTTKTVELFYHGYYTSANGLRQAFVKVGEQLMIGGPDTVVLNDWEIDEVTAHRLILKNEKGETKILPFNSVTELEVPIE